MKIFVGSIKVLFIRKQATILIYISFYIKINGHRKKDSNFYLLQI